MSLAERYSGLDPALDQERQGWYREAGIDTPPLHGTDRLALPRVRNYPALSLWQPWASAMALGVKRVETRSWPAPASLIGQELAIHAAKRRPTQEEREAWGPLLAQLGLAWEPCPAMERQGVRWKPLPYGAVLCVVRLERCVRTEDLVHEISEQERAWGDYRRGRWGWVTEMVEVPAEPVPYRGAQGVFTWRRADG